MKVLLILIVLSLTCVTGKCINKEKEIRALIVSKEYTTALKELNLLIQENEKVPWLHECKGLALVGIENHELAIKSFMKARKLGADKLSSFVNIGDALFKNGQYEKAHDCFLLASSIDSTNYKVNFNRALCLYFLNELDEAIIYFNKAKDINPNECDLYFIVAEIFNAKNDCEQGLYNVNVGLKIDSTYHRGHFIKGLLYYKMKDYNKAIISHSIAVNFNPLESEYYCKRAVAYYMIGQYDKALKDYSLAVELDNTCTEAYQGKAYVYKELGNDSLCHENYLLFQKYSNTKLQE